MATQAGSLEIVEYLANIGVNLDATNIVGHSATSVAQNNFHHDINRFLKSFKKNQTVLFAYNDAAGIGNISNSSPYFSDTPQTIVRHNTRRAKIFGCFGF